ncbi:MAG: CHAT domain-containing protein, partial [Rhodothermales bacterium]|nr:CHAT domain-containing protein [Rhodothermales bacterium]
VIVRGMQWDPLAGAAAEAEDVQESLGDTEYGPVVTYSDSLALEETFKDVRRPRILHVATHGYFLKEVDEDAATATEAIGGASFGAARGLGMLRTADNPLLRSGVILAGANNIGIEEVEGVDDGWVTAEEISLMDLRGTELVVLSACESGLGDIKSGQSVQGLRQAFQLAGAQSILSTLYKVPDTETRQIVKSFYGHLRDGLSTTEALNKAQREMIRQRREEHGGAHPFFWASFIAVGS